MIPDQTLERIHRRLARVLAPPAELLTPFEMDGAAIGWITRERAQRLHQTLATEPLNTPRRSLEHVLASVWNTR